MNILLLEDHANILFNLNEMLSKRGHIVFEAFYVPQALTFWRERKIDLLVIDLNVNGMGLDFLGIKFKPYLAGWAFLQNIVYVEKPEFMRKTIIFSEYIDELQMEYQNLPDEIKLVPKHGKETATGQLMSVIEKYQKDLLREE